MRHAGVLPDVDGVLRVSVGADKLGSGRAEEKVTDLAAGVVGAEEMRVQRRVEI